MARSKPIHKYALVLGIKELDYIVAVTGDGTNDAPALSKSDVGFSMFDGTDIAKNSSDIIIMDNNFASIVNAIKYGRNIIENLRKFLQFQFIINMSLCSFVIITSCIGSQSPFTTIQMLWIDLIMDALGSLALATEPPHKSLLLRKPNKKDEDIINKKMMIHIISHSALKVIILMTIYLFGPKFINEENEIRRKENELIKKCFEILPGGGTDINKIIYGISSFWYTNVEIKKELVRECGKYSDSHNLSEAFLIYNENNGSVHFTMLFNIFVLYTLFNKINCRVFGRSLNIFWNIKKNPIFVIIIICEFIAHFCFIQFCSGFFKLTTEGLTLIQWLICIAFSISAIILEMILNVFVK